MSANPKQEITAESLAVTAGGFWLLFRWPPCQEANVAAVETNSLAVILLYYQRNQTTPGRVTAAG
jgi:hypothetical protein